MHIRLASKVRSLNLSSSSCRSTTTSDVHARRNYLLAPWMTHPNKLSSSPNTFRPLGFIRSVPCDGTSSEVRGEDLAEAEAQEADGWRLLRAKAVPL